MRSWVIGKGWPSFAAFHGLRYHLINFIVLSQLNYDIATVSLLKHHPEDFRQYENLLGFLDFDVIIMYLILRVHPLLANEVCDLFVLYWPWHGTCLVNEVSPLPNPRCRNHIIAKTSIFVLDNLFVIVITFIQFKVFVTSHAFLSPLNYIRYYEVSAWEEMVSLVFTIRVILNKILILFCLFLIRIVLELASTDCWVHLCICCFYWSCAGRCTLADVRSLIAWSSRHCIYIFTFTFASAIFAQLRWLLFFLFFWAIRFYTQLIVICRCAWAFHTRSR